MAEQEVCLEAGLAKTGAVPKGASAKAPSLDAAAAAAAEPMEVDEEDLAAMEDPDAKDKPPVVEPKKVEVEEDAPEDKRKRIAGPVGFHVPDTTINVMTASHGGLLMPMTEGGLQYLLAGARANVGIKNGRYAFEAKIVEYVNQAEAFAQSRAPGCRYLLRIGFSVAGATPILGDTEESVCFDSEGAFLWNKTKVNVSKKIGVDCVVAVVLNLNETGPHANTISIYKDGVRLCVPQLIPQALRGKTLYPTVTFKNMTVHVNFGPELYEPLPFKCRAVADASEDDTHPSLYEKPKDGKYELVLPCCLPDQGTFDWLEWFIGENPYFTEISDRKIIEWAVRSGFWRPKNPTSKASNDKPDMNLGVPQLDDGSVRFLLTMAAALQERDVVIMEVRGNWLANERVEILKPFKLPHWKKVAKVMVGNPEGTYKDILLARMLKDKQEVANAEFNDNRKDRVARKQMADRQKMLEKMKKKALREEAKKKREEAQANGQEVEEPPPEEEEEEEDAEPMEVDPTEEPPKVQLNSEDKEDYFKRQQEKATTPDVAQQILANSFPNFTLPAKEDGLDEVRFDWKPQFQSEELLKRWMVERRMTNRIENLQPSEWFKEKWGSWQKDLQVWHMKHMEFKDPAKRAAMMADAKAKNGKKDQEKKDGSKEADAPMTEEERAKAEKEHLEKDPMEQLAEELEQTELDVFGVDDICDLGTGEPLFANFAFEDWALLSLRFEMHLMVHAFKRDCGDPERTGFPPEHLQFYFNRYYKKALSPKNYGAEKIEELVKMIGDTVCVCSRVIESQLSPELESNGIFVMLTEEARRERQARIDGGDESAKLKFSSRAAEQQAASLGAKAQAAPATQAKAATFQAPTPGGKGSGSGLWPGGGPPGTGAKQMAAPPGSGPVVRPPAASPNWGAARSGGMFGMAGRPWMPMMGKGGGKGWGGPSFGGYAGWRPGPYW